MGYNSGFKGLIIFPSSLTPFAVQMSRHFGFFLMSLPPSPSATVSIQNSSPKPASEIRFFFSIIKNRFYPENQLNTHLGELLCVQHRRFSSGRYSSPQQVSETSSVLFIRKFRTVEKQHISEILNCYSELTQLVDHYNTA